MIDRWPARPRPGTHCDTYIGGWDTGFSYARTATGPSWCPNPAVETLLHPERDAVCWMCQPCADARVAQGYRRNPKRRQ